MARRKALYSLADETRTALAQLQALGFAASASAAVDRAVAEALRSLQHPTTPSRALLETIAAQLSSAQALLNAALINPNAAEGDDWPQVGSRTVTPNGEGVIVGYDAHHEPPYRVDVAGVETWEAGENLEPIQ
jgi:hypothetical protein